MLPDGTPCPGCRARPPRYGRLVVLFDYRACSAGREWVLALKHRGRGDLAGPLGRLLAARLRDSGVGKTRVLGPAAPPIARLRGKHRRQLIVLGPDRERVRDAIVAATRILVERNRLPRDWVIDVEPMSMM